MAGVADLIHAHNYPTALEHLTEVTRLGMLQKLAQLNTRTVVNSLHITLNFDPSEALSKETLVKIAGTYMDKIGFGNQPYLIYQHHDAGHPHIHIVTTNIEANGNRIDLHHLGILKSEPARKEVEMGFNLVKAEDSKEQDYQLKPAYSGKVVYGRSDSRRAIANVLNVLLPSYKYGSLAELNALLSQYNVYADRGSKCSRVYKNNGLNYRILDDNGNPVGVPIKASSFHNKPTLKFLLEQFEANKTGKSKLKSKLKTSIDFTLKGLNNASFDKFSEHLKRIGIVIVLRKNETGLIYGITYIDHRNKCVFNGRDLGKDLSAKAILERFPDLYPFQQDSGHHKKNLPADLSAPNDNILLPASTEEAGDTAGKGLLEELMEPEYTNDALPYELTGKKKRKKRKKI